MENFPNSVGTRRWCRLALLLALLGSCSPRVAAARANATATGLASFVPGDDAQVHAMSEGERVMFYVDLESFTPYAEQGPETARVAPPSTCPPRPACASSAPRSGHRPARR